jgi:hypothetical protein
MRLKGRETEGCSKRAFASSGLMMEILLRGEALLAAKPEAELA